MSQEQLFNVAEVQKPKRATRKKVVEEFDENGNPIAPKPKKTTTKKATETAELFEKLSEFLSEKTSEFQVLSARAIQDESQSIKEQIDQINQYVQQYFDHQTNAEISDVAPVSNKEQDMSFVNALNDKIQSLQNAIQSTQEQISQIPVLDYKHQFDAHLQTITIVYETINAKLKSASESQENALATYKSNLEHLLSEQLKVLISNFEKDTQTHQDLLAILKDDLHNIYKKTSTMQKSLEEIAQFQTNFIGDHKNTLEVHRSILSAKLINNEQQLHQFNKDVLTFSQDQKLATEQLQEQITQLLSAIDLKHNGLKDTFDITQHKLSSDINTQQNTAAQQHQQQLQQIAHVLQELEQLKSLQDTVDKQFEIVATTQNTQLSEIQKLNEIINAQEVAQQSAQEEIKGLKTLLIVVLIMGILAIVAPFAAKFI